MRAVVVREYGKEPVIEDISKPTPAEDQVLVRITFTGLCHTDLHVMDGDLKGKLPVIPGHEGVGEVVEKGSQVSEVDIGDVVGIPWLHSACGKCDFCHTGKENLCPNQENTGFTVNGCFSEYVLAKASHVVKIPSGLKPEEATSILCAGLTGYKALKESKVSRGQYVVLFGCGGGLGHLCCQYALALGMKVVAVDMPDKLDFCRDLGVEVGFSAVDPELLQKVVAHTGEGAHGAICLTPASPALRCAAKVCRRGGTVVLVGLPKDDVPLPVVDCIMKELSVVGSLVGTKTVLKEALDIAARGFVKSHVKVVDFHKVGKAVNDLKCGKVCGRYVLKF